jgi:hypothetical protein
MMGGQGQDSCPGMASARHIASLSHEAPSRERPTRIMLPLVSVAAPPRIGDWGAGRPEPPGSLGRTVVEKASWSIGT